MTGFPTPPCFFKKTQLPIGIPATTFDPAALVKRTARDSIAIGQAGFRFIPKPGDRRLQLRGNALVSIQTEDPVICSLVNGKLLLGGETRPIPRENAGAAGFGDLTCLIRRAGVDNDYFVGPTQ